jgi:hypothetical protein
MPPEVRFASLIHWAVPPFTPAELPLNPVYGLEPGIPGLAGTATTNRRVVGVEPTEERRSNCSESGGEEGAVISLPGEGEG